MLLGFMAILIGASLSVSAAEPPRPPAQGELAFSDANAQTRVFIRYFHEIPLSAAQQKIMDEALRPIPAPCCRDYPMLTCCCPCNMAKGVWGLSHYLIAKKGYDAAQVGAMVEKWLEFLNRDGFTGDACYTGGCSRAFDKNGCGGMNEAHVIARSGR